MLDSVDDKLLRVKTVNFYETLSIYHSNITLYGGGGKLGMEKCEKSAIRSNNFGNDCRLATGYNLVSKTLHRNSLIMKNTCFSFPCCFLAYMLKSTTFYSKN